jgi:hypothetical protein
MAANAKGEPNGINNKTKSMHKMIKIMLMGDLVVGLILRSHSE